MQRHNYLKPFTAKKKTAPRALFEVAIAQPALPEHCGQNHKTVMGSALEIAAVTAVTHFRRVPIDAGSIA